MTESFEQDAALALTVTLSPEQVDALARRVADVLGDSEESDAMWNRCAPSACPSRMVASDAEKGNVDIAMIVRLEKVELSGKRARP